MNKEYLETLEEIRSTLEDIQIIQDDLGGVLTNPNAYLGMLIEIRTALEEIQYIREDIEEAV